MGDPICGTGGVCVTADSSKTFRYSRYCPGTICSRVLTSSLHVPQPQVQWIVWCNRERCQSRQWEGKAIKTSSEGERDKGSGDLIKRRRETEESSDQKEGFVRCFSSLLRNGHRGISLTGFEVSLGSVSTLPFGSTEREQDWGTISEHNLC